MSRYRGLRIVLFIALLTPLLTAPIAISPAEAALPPEVLALARQMAAPQENTPAVTTVRPSPPVAAHIGAPSDAELDPAYLSLAQPGDATVTLNTEGEQVYGWTWMSGASTLSQAGVYGTKGVPAPGNVPGARSNSISWSDAADNLWLMGGYGRDSAGSWGDLNDLWRYDSNGQWTWLSGAATRNQAGVYGTRGIPAPGNVPGARSNSISWIDAAGNLLLLGGGGYDSAGNVGSLNDLWRYDTNGQWTWMSGSDTYNQAGVYGTRDVPAPGNVPGARSSSISWSDAAGNLWLFGGEGYDSAGNSGYLNDLWRYDSNGQWTWLSGANTVNQAGVYGTQGVPAPGNVPGARARSISWSDAAGNLWLLGGYGYDSAGNRSYLNDLWRYDANGQWTWMSGANTVNQAGVYGMWGIPAPGNVPGARYHSISWSDAAGNLWLMGGYGRDSAGNSGYLNDLWRYDTNGQWTWLSGASTRDQAGVYGTQGVPAPGNVPGARSSSISWSDAAGNLWLLGGHGYDSAGNRGYLNDLWRYGHRPLRDLYLDKSVVLTDNTLYHGVVTYTFVLYNTGIESDFDVSLADTLPDTIIFEQWLTQPVEGDLIHTGNVITWTGELPAQTALTFAFTARHTGNHGDVVTNTAYFSGTLQRGSAAAVFALDSEPHSWVWVSGANTINQPGIYGPRGVPGAREDSISWSDSAGNLWLFGGAGYDSAGNSGYLNDLWRYDSNGQWTWLSGASTRNQAGVYGTRGVPAPGNVPGAREDSISWIDSAGNLWLMGGNGYDSTGDSGYLNDLWRYDANGQWTWLSGANTADQHGVYGTRGVPAPGNVPGARWGSISWSDAAGNLWLMGGYGNDSIGEGRLNDLWRYDTNGRWTWMSGANTVNQAGLYGTKGVPAPGNVPGGRQHSISWIDSTGNLWLFGGYGYDSTGNSGYLNDLWRYDTNGRWAWMSGANTRNQAGVYGTRGIPAPGNVPGARSSSISWIDPTDNLWLLEGVKDSGTSFLNDLWRYSNGQWTWMGGTNTTGRQPGIYGTLGVPAPGNIPGARAYSIAWSDSAGNPWLFGGWGYDSAGDWGHLNDLWCYQLLPLHYNPVLVKSVTPNLNVPYHDVVTYTLSLHNSGVEGDPAVILTDTLPANVTFVQWVTQPAAGDLVRASNAITWTGELPAQTALTFAFTAWHTGNYGDVVTNTAHFSGTLQQGSAAAVFAVDRGPQDWVWLSGADDTITQIGVYGTRGVPAPDNVPGAREGSISWSDSAGNLWLFGGEGYDSTGNRGSLNDLWRYDANGQWTWLSGADTAGQHGVYGTKGVPAPGNVPGTRHDSISWSDAAGNLWLFGGSGLDRAGIWGALNDLWRYDTNGQWTWLSGASTRDQAGVYGTRGVPAPGNILGARYESISWSDSAGNLWVFGGYGHDSAGNWGRLNDLWRYDTNGRWTWLSGASTVNQAGVYGTQGVPAAGNVPGARSDSISWSDAAGNLWLMGGYGRASAGNSGYLNDLWRYDTNGRWTWLSGAKTCNQVGVYGTQGVPAPGNVPGARSDSISWSDSAGNLWLFGGAGYDSAGNSGRLNDLWRYDANGRWMWLSGADTANQAGVYGAQGIFAPGNLPGARSGSISWSDAAGNLWLLGGSGHDSTGNYVHLNDLWRYGAREALPLQVPVLSSINNPSGLGGYLVNWETVSGATSYTLQESRTSNFSNAVVRYTGAATQFTVVDQPHGTWYYRVQATGQSDNVSPWSNTRSVLVKSWVYLPLTLRDYVTYFEGPWEVEPNDTWQQANGPLVSGRTYYGKFPSASDAQDYFSLYLRSSQSVELWLSNIGAGHNYDLVLRNTALQLVGYSANLGNTNEHIRTGALAPGWYYIQVFNYGGTDSTQGYNLKVVHPAAALTAAESELPAPASQPPLPTPIPPSP